MALTLVVTDAGRAALVNAANTGTAPMTVTQLGLSSTATVPATTATALPGEFKRLATLSGDVVADDTIHMIGRDEGTDVYVVRSFALYLNDGTLFAIYGQADPIVDKAAQSIMLLALDVRLADIDAASLTFGDANFLNPPATETVKGVAEIATQAESDAGTDDQRIVTPKKNKTSVLAWVASWFSDVWRASNDGSGSGLDADLLDGQQGSWYSNIIARLGFTPANKAGDTFSGNITAPAYMLPLANAYLLASGNILYLQGDSSDYLFYDRTGNTWGVTIGGVVQASIDGNGNFSSRVGMLAAGNTVWHAGNDGAGSGLDADLLDGQDSAYYGNIPARLGYTPANRGGDTFTGEVAIGYVGNVGLTLNSLGAGLIRLAAQTDGNMVLYRNTGDGDHPIWTINSNTGPFNIIVPVTIAGNTAWHAGNDGSGSGLDADLLDGHHASDFVGMGATWKDLGTVTYARQNTTGRTIEWCISANGNSGHIQVSNDGVIWFSVTPTIDHGRAQLTIPAGGWARVDAATLESWIELS